jgi:hypothetical protein
MLNDTLNLIQLARETARLQGKQDQVEVLKPVVDGLRSMIGPGVAPGSASSPGRVDRAGGLTPHALPPAPVSGELAQSDFRALLAAVSRNDAPAQPAATLPATPPPLAASQDRSGIILAMASGGMADLEIARQMGMTREEVGVILRLGQGKISSVKPNS